nr:phage holin family protein [uncultured Carboxylicivirga sp.]
MALIFYFAPVAPLVHAVLALIAIDWLTGVWRSKKAHRILTSYRFRKSINKIAAYLIAIITAHIVDADLLGGVLHLPEIVAAYIGFTELTSIYENLSDITGKQLLKDIAIDITNHIKQKIIKP